MPQQTIAIQEIIAAGKCLAEAGLSSAHSGNISRRLDNGCLLITASGVRKGSMTEADILCLDDQGSLLEQGAEGRCPSSETGLHLALYQACPHIAAIVHAHPPYATALTTAGRALDWQMLEESRLFLGPVPRIPPLPAGSAELARAAACAAIYAADGTNTVNALLLAGHGAVSWGESLDIAVCRMEILEHTARVMLYKRLFQAD